jgi:hypothetical protein
MVPFVPYVRLRRNVGRYEPCALSLYRCLICGHGYSEPHEDVLVTLNSDADSTRCDTKGRGGGVGYGYIRCLEIRQKGSRRIWSIWIVVDRNIPDASYRRSSICATGERRYIGTLVGGVPCGAPGSFDDTIVCVEKVSACDNRHDHQEKESSRNGKFHYGDAALRFFAVVTSHIKILSRRGASVHVAHLGGWL